MTVSITSASIPGDLPSKFSTIASAGFRGVELCEDDFARFDGTADDVARIARDLDLAIVAFQTTADVEGLRRGQKTRVFDRLEQLFDLLPCLGADLLIASASTKADAAACPDSIAADFAELADSASKRGLRAAILARPWASAVRSDSEALEVIRQVDSAHLGLVLNSLLSLGGGARLARLNEIEMERVFHVQIADGPSRERAIDERSARLRLLPGQGYLNLSGFARIIGRNGYDGAWSLDGASGPASQLGAKDIASDGYRAMVNLLGRAGRREPDAAFEIPSLPPRVYASGVEFIEFTADDADADALTELLASLRFRRERRHVSKSVELWRQGAVNIVVNCEKDGFAYAAYLQHGPTVCDMGLRVADAQATVARATALGAPRFSQPVGRKELDIPAVRGVGGNVVHFIDEKSDLHRVWDIEFNPVSRTAATQPAGIRRIDHIAQTMKYEEMQSWLLYYISTFEMEKSPIVDVADPLGVVRSQALQSPEGEIRFTLNGADQSPTLAGAFLADQQGAGVQHIAFQTDDIFETSALLEASDFTRLQIPQDYYSRLQKEFGLDGAFLERLAQHHILYDRDARGEYFQIYSAPIFDGFFFEIVERRSGYAGYGARNAPVRLAAQARNHKQRPDPTKSGTQLSNPV